MDIQKRCKILAEQWQLFHAGLNVDCAIVSSEILNSWKRCKDANVDMKIGNRHKIPPQRLEKLLCDNNLLIQASKSIMERLYEPISLSKSIITLADSDGIVLYCLKDETNNYPIPNIEPGSLPLENYSGTNATSLCLQLKRPVTTLGAEHYCSILHNWFCSAAPIMDNNQNLRGILTLTLPWNMFHYHTFGMVETTAFAISEQLRLYSLLFEQEATFEIIDEGLIIINPVGDIYAINKKAQKMLSIPAKTNIKNIKDIIFSEDIIKTLLSENPNFYDQEAICKIRGSSLNCMLSVTSSNANKRRVITLREVKKLKETAAKVAGAKAVFIFEDIICESPEMKSTIALAKRAATSEAPTLIMGESGTGKELFAQSIHNGSSRVKGAFITVNCGALPRELVQSELFGYDEGAFTGASRMGKAGKFELADNGTIFLDEIGEMPMDAQVSLLRLLQNGEVTRVGSKYTRHVNVRVIAATNRDLQKAIAMHTFREDLYWRLNVFSFRIPALRERPGDIKVLIHHFLSRYRMLLNKPKLQIAYNALQILVNYSWPGNVRELENMMERMSYMCTDSNIIDISTIPEQILCFRNGIKKNEFTMGLLNRQEKESIIKILQESGGNIRETARNLGISRSCLYMKIKKFDIDVSKCRKGL